MLLKAAPQPPAADSLAKPLQEHPRHPPSGVFCRLDRSMVTGRPILSVAADTVTGYEQRSTVGCHRRQQIPRSRQVHREPHNRAARRRAHSTHRSPQRVGRQAGEGRAAGAVKHHWLSDSVHHYPNGGRPTYSAYALTRENVEVFTSPTGFPHAPVGFVVVDVPCRVTASQE